MTFVESTTLFAYHPSLSPQNNMCALLSAAPLSRTTRRFSLFLTLSFIGRIAWNALTNLFCSLIALALTENARCWCGESWCSGWQKIQSFMTVRSVRLWQPFGGTQGVLLDSVRTFPNATRRRETIATKIQQQQRWRHFWGIPRLHYFLWEARFFFRCGEEIYSFDISASCVRIQRFRSWWTL